MNKIIDLYRVSTQTVIAIITYLLGLWICAEEGIIFNLRFKKSKGGSEGIRENFLEKVVLEGEFPKKGDSVSTSHLVHLCCVEPSLACLSWFVGQTLTQWVLITLIALLSLISLGGISFYVT